MGILTSVVILAGLFTSRPLVDPSPVPVDTSRNPTQVFAATLGAVTGAGWQPSLVDDKTIRAVFVRRPHVATVLLKVGRDSVTMSYESSANLAYDKQGSNESIHKAYMEWTGSLMSSIRLRLNSLCADMTSLQDPSRVGMQYASLVDAVPPLGTADKQFVVKSASGSETGYVIREYQAFLAGGTSECEPVSTVYYNDKFVSLMRAPMEPAALIAYADVLSYLVEQKQISFADSEMERMSLKLDVVTPLESPRREELLRFVEWQAQRFESKESSQKEYQYLVAQKEAEVQERQGAIDQKEQELGLMRHQQAMQGEALNVQRQQLAAQRSLAIGQAIANLTRSLSYQPAVRTSISCNSYAFGNSVQTNCH